MFQQAAYADSQYSQVSTFTWADGDQNIVYDYDDNGSLISKITYKRVGSDAEFIKGLRYDYNLQNRLVAIWDLGDDEIDPADDELLTEYSYNTSGIRTQKIDYETTPAQLTTYLIDPANHTGYAQVLEETTYDDDGSGGWAPATRIQYTIGDDVLSQTTSTYSGGWSAGNTQYLLYDGHGSTRQLVDSGQNIGSNYNYDAYGTLLQDGSAESNPGITPQQNTSLLYAGEMFDTNSQMYYNRARWYNTLNGTFNRTDPYAGNLQDPQSLHKYAYVHNNPVNYIDPLGLFTLVQALFVTGIILNIVAIAIDLIDMHTAAKNNDTIALATARNWLMVDVLILVIPFSGAGGQGLKLSCRYGTVAIRSAQSLRTLDLVLWNIYGIVKAASSGDWDYNIGPHESQPSPRPNGSNSHHGVMSEWMRNHFPNYNPKKAPTMLIPQEYHNKMSSVYNKWRKMMTQKMGGVFDWKKVSFSDIKKLSETMFDVADISPEVRGEYWNAYKDYVDTMP